MKKVLSLFALTALAGALVVGAAANSRVAKGVAADAPAQTYVKLTDGWVQGTDGWGDKTVNELLRGRNDRFWSGNADQNNWDSQERTFNGTDEFIDTIHKAGTEEWRGNYRTPELTLADNDHRYISFMFGGGETDIFINVFHVRTTYQGNLIDDKEGDGDRWIAKYGEGYNRDVIRDIRPFFDGSGTFDDKEAKFNAPRTCNMTFRYYRLPDSIEVGDQFLIFVRDGKTGGYGGFTFGDVHINQTLEDCAKSFSAHKTQMKLNRFTSDWNKNAIDSVLNFYGNDSYYDDIRDAEAALTDANDGFEVNDHLSKWAYDLQNSTYENGDLANINFDSIYSDKDWKWGGFFFDNNGLMPTNKSGNMYLTGEPDDSDGPNCGLPESAKYRLISPEFKLSGTGLISAKLGGHFSELQLLDSNFNIIARTGATNPSFVVSTEDSQWSNIAESGVRLNTMVRTYLDCGEFVNQRVHVALVDTQTGGNWNLSYFDEVVTKYTNNPGLKIDLTDQHPSSNDSIHYHGYILDKYINNSHNASFKEAYDFLQTYYSSLRSPANRFDYAYASSETKTSIGSEYALLSEGAKAIVDNSEDLQVVGNYNSDWWFNNFDKSEKVSVFVPDELSTTVRTISFNAGSGSGEMESIRKLDGKTFNLPACSFTAPEHKEFAGWKVNGAGETLAVGTEITVESDVSLVAQWSLLKFTVTYNANGGTGDDYAVDNVEYGTEYAALALANTGISAPSGKKFVEWNTSEDGSGDSFDPADQFTVTDDVTLFAIWEDTAKTKIEALTTRSLLSYGYTDNGDGTFSYSNVKIRFGGFVTEALWNELNGESEIQGYGVMISTADTEGGYIGENTFKGLYATAIKTADGNVDAAINLVCNNEKIKNFYHDIENDTPYLYEAAEHDNISENTYAWNLAQKITSPANLTRTYVSIAYIRTSQGLVFLNEVRVSPKSVAQSMLASSDYDSESFNGSLEYLANL